MGISMTTWKCWTERRIQEESMYVGAKLSSWYWIHIINKNDAYCLSDPLAATDWLQCNHFIQTSRLTEEETKERGLGGSHTGIAGAGTALSFVGAQGVFHCPLSWAIWMSCETGEACPSVPPRKRCCLGERPALFPFLSRPKALLFLCPSLQPWLV